MVEQNLDRFGPKVALDADWEVITILRIEGWPGLRLWLQYSLEQVTHFFGPDIEHLSPLKLINSFSVSLRKLTWNRKYERLFLYFRKLFRDFVLLRKHLVSFIEKLLSLAIDFLLDIIDLFPTQHKFTLVFRNFPE
jgi:hypothetical protein